MTVTRAYDRGGTRRRPRGARAGLPWLLGVTAVGAQVVYPLVEDAWLRRVTIAAVVLFFGASVVHAAVHRGRGWAAGLVLVTGGGGLLAEAVGLRTGLPFGDYTYATGSESLGPTVLDVPVVVPLAWTMMAYPVFLAARRMTRRFVAPAGGFGLAAWDVFLDPQMVADGRWTWADPTPALPGVEGVPAGNFLGWFLVGTAMMFVLDLLLRRDRSSEAVPATLLLWTWVGSVVGNVFFFGDPSIAVAGGVAMGLFVLPYAWSLWQSRP
jgi:putative membrane protein